MVAFFRIVIFTILVALTAGCEGRYEMKEDKLGRIIRLDSWTGEVAILKEGVMITVSDATEQEWTQIMRDADVDGLGIYIYESAEECEAARQKKLKRHPSVVCSMEERYYIKENGKKLFL